MSLDKWGIVVAEVFNSNRLRLRALIDLQHHEFSLHQRYGVIGSLNTAYPNRMTDQTRLSRDFKFNKGYHPYKYLDVTASKYVMVILLYAKDDYIMNQLTWKPDADNLVDIKLMDYMTSNIKDLVIIRGTSVPKACKKITIMFQVGVGCREIMNSLYPTKAGLPHQTLSLSNCGELNAPFQFESWQGARPTPGKMNDCSGGNSLGVEETDKSKCENLCSGNVIEITSSTELTSDNFETGGSSNLQENIGNSPSAQVDLDTRESSNVQVDIENSLSTELDTASNSQAVIATLDSSDACHVQRSDESNVMENIFDNYNNNGKQMNQDCAHSPGVRKDMAQIDTKLDVILARKRKFFESLHPTYNDERWNGEDKFNEDWIQHIEDHQKHLIPIAEFSAARTWIELLTNTDEPWKSTMRCRLCHTNIPLYAADRNWRSPFSLDEGVLLPRLSGPKGNKQAIINHEKNPTHVKLIQRMKEEQVLAAYDDIIFVEERHQMVTAQVFRSIYMAIKQMGSSFNSIEHLMNHMTESGVDMGTQCHSPASITKIVASISDSMHQRLVKSLKTGTEPLSIILDSSTDVSKKDVLAVLIRTLEEDVPVTYFYGLIELKSDGRAIVQTQCLLDKLKSDGSYDAIKSRIIAFISDGASVMQGKWKGMGTLLRKEFGPQLVSVHCGAHRLELMFGHSMDSFDNFKRIEEQANKLHAFYGMAAKKRYGSLVEFLKTNDIKEFAISKIYKVRWVDSHREVIKKIYDHLPEIIGHLKEIIENERNPESSTSKKAKALLKFYTNKNVLINTAYQIDVQAIFSKVSKIMQDNDESIVGFSHSKILIEEGLGSLRDPTNGEVTKELLSEASCNGVPCLTLEQYEQSQNVVWKGVQLEDVWVRGICGYDDFQKLSEIYNEYLDKIDFFLQQYMPEIKIMDFILLDNREWNNNWSYIEMKKKMTGIMSVLKLTKPVTVVRELIKLIETIEQRGDWCTLQNSNPTWFWSKIMKDRNVVISQDLKQIIQSALAIAISSADAERVFSDMNYAKDKKRARLSLESTENIIRIKKNGPSPSSIDMSAYVADYLRFHERCDPLFDRSARKRAKIGDQCEEDKKSTQASEYSKLFI